MKKERLSLVVKKDDLQNTPEPPSSYI